MTQQFITDVESIIEVTEQAKGFWDAQGLDLHIAVKSDGIIAVSTKHWARVHYITTDITIDQIWLKIEMICRDIGRTLIRSKNGPYVYINKLNLVQTQHIFDLFKKTFGNNITRVWEFDWEIENAVVPVDTA